MYKRRLNISELLEKRSFFLFGARATGKTTLIQTSLPQALVIDLLDTRTYKALLQDAGVLADLIRGNQKIVVIDEIQKLPNLLDEVHRLIQKEKRTFLLTGSSARKLKHGSANLLAGRAREARLFPLTWPEINAFDLVRLLNHGGLPEIYDSSEPDEDLEAYVDTYLKEEIKAEAVTRNVAAFAEFLDIIGRANGQELNYESFSSDLQVSPSTFKNYLQILEDTLIGFRLPGFTKTKKRKATVRAKHYLFDLGVTRHLAKAGMIRAKSKEFGDAFEHFIILEVRAYLSYHRKKQEMSYWRSTSQFEVDLIIGGRIGIEIKSADLISDKHLKGLRALAEEKIMERLICIHTGHLASRSADGIEILPFQDFLTQLWAGDML
jgi:predicted AAA+ superfamily ATPase